MSALLFDKLQIIGLLAAILGGISILTTSWRLSGRQEAPQAKFASKNSKVSSDFEERGGGGDPKAGEPDS